MRKTITSICIFGLLFAGLAQSVGCAGPSSANMSEIPPETELSDYTENEETT